MIQTTFNVTWDDLLSEEDIQGSLAIRQHFSKQLYLGAVICLVFALIFAWLSFWAVTSGNLPWVLPLRITSVIFVIGYVAFAMTSKANYQRKVKRPATIKGRIILRVILGCIIVGVVLFYLLGIGE